MKPARSATDHGAHNGCSQPHARCCHFQIRAFLLLTSMQLTSVSDRTSRAPRTGGDVRPVLHEHDVCAVHHGEIDMLTGAV